MNSLIFRFNIWKAYGIDLIFKFNIWIIKIIQRSDLASKLVTNCLYCDTVSIAISDLGAQNMDHNFSNILSVNLGLVRPVRLQCSVASSVTISKYVVLTHVLQIAHVIPSRKFSHVIRIHELEQDWLYLSR